MEGIKKIKIDGVDKYFKLTTSDGDIDLVVCDKEGKKLDNGIVLVITDEGKFERYPGITKDSGLRLNKVGKVIEDRS